MDAINQDYTEKLAKTQGEQFQSLSQIAGGAGDVAKLQNQYSNYSIRNGMYYITAPQPGQITKAKKAGIGEIIKDGEMLVEIVPVNTEFAVELFIEPMDLPLISAQQKIRFVFDGFPAVVFSGWPNASYGTFGGEVVAVENAVSTNGKFRVLVKEDIADKKRWPSSLKIGTGTQAIALLKNVPVWYELWRNINGFPQDFYTNNLEKEKRK
jgi:multidrug resistance efflux pump